MKDQAARLDVYEIRIKGHLPPDWANWLSELELTYLENGETLLCGPVADQAALHGLLAKIRDMNLLLIAVQRL